MFAAVAATAVTGIVVGWLSCWPTKLRLRAELRTCATLLRLARYDNDHDRLTGLFNREAAEVAFNCAVDVHGELTVLALLDLDGFKQVNDTYGHEVGDQLIRAVGARLAAAARTYGATAARLAGDEFLLLLPATADLAVVVADVLARLAEPVELATDDGDVTLRTQASAGVAVHDGADDIWFTDLLHHADIALYHAKQHRGTWRHYQPPMHMPANDARHGPRRRDQHPTSSAGRQP